MQTAIAAGQGSANPLNVVREVYAAYARRDLPAIAALYDPECELIQTAQLPWGGRHRGHRGLEQFFSLLTQAIDTRIVDETLFEAGDRVVSIGRTRGVSRATGRTFDIPAVHVYTVEGGRIRRYEAYVDTPAMQKAIGLA